MCDDRVKVDHLLPNYNQRRLNAKAGTFSAGNRFIFESDIESTHESYIE